MVRRRPPGRPLAGVFRSHRLHLSGVNYLDRPVRIIVAEHSRDYWFKIVEFLQQNWALIDQDANGPGCTVFFFGDTSSVFDRLRFPSVVEAEIALLRNGFKRYDSDE